MPCCYFLRCILCGRLLLCKLWHSHDRRPRATACNLCVAPASGAVATRASSSWPTTCRTPMATQWIASSTMSRPTSAPAGSGQQKQADPPAKRIRSAAIAHSTSSAKYPDFRFKTRVVGPSPGLMIAHVGITTLIPCIFLLWLVDAGAIMAGASLMSLLGGRVISGSKAEAFELSAIRYPWDCGRWKKVEPKVGICQGFRCCSCWRHIQTREAATRS